MKPALFLLAALAPLLASCQPPTIHAEAVFLDGRLAFVDSEGGEPTGCWRDGVVVDASLDPAWQFDSGGLGECDRPLLPLLFGKAPQGGRTTVPARRPDTGRLYLLLGDATSKIEAAFILSRVAGGRIQVTNVDPDAPEVQALKERWWRRESEAGAPVVQAAVY